MEKSALFCCLVPARLQPGASEAGVERLSAGRFWPDYMVMRGVSAHDYTLIQAAKAITGNGSGLALEDLADTEDVDDTAFRLVVNALRYGPEHHSHLTVGEAVAFARRVGAERTFFTHMGHDIGLHEDVNRRLPGGVSLAYDGETVEIG